MTILSFPDFAQGAFLTGSIPTTWRKRLVWSDSIEFHSISQLSIVKDSLFTARFSADSGLLLPTYPLGHLLFRSAANERILACLVLSASNGRGYYEVRLSGPILIDDGAGKPWVIDQIRDKRIYRDDG